MLRVIHSVKNVFYILQDFTPFKGIEYHRKNATVNACKVQDMTKRKGMQKSIHSLITNTVFPNRKF